MYSIPSPYHSSSQIEEHLLKITPQAIQNASECLKDIILKTPTQKSAWLSNHTQGDVYLKLENLQVTGSYKARGSYIRLKNLTKEECKRGVITMLAGNHTLGVAYHAKNMGIPATIVIPENTPIAKVERTRSYGASIILHGKSALEARDFAMQLIKKHGYTLIHSFDDPDIIIGQGTVGLEILQEVPNLDAIIVPIGGGGLAAGVSVIAKALNPNIQIIGVQTENFPSTAEILFPNVIPIEVKKTQQTIAEGIAINSPGHLTMSVLSKTLDDMFIVSEEEIEHAIESLMIHNKIIAEGASAAGVAALYKANFVFKDKKVGVVVSGGNIDPRLLSSLLLKGLIHGGRLVRLKIQINDNPGILGYLTQIIGKAGGNIFEMSQQRLFNNIMVKMAYVDAVVETRDAEHAKSICTALIEGGFPTEIIED